MKPITIILISLNLWAGAAWSQTTAKNNDTPAKTDSIKRAYLDKAAIAYPLLRQGAISTDVMGSRNNTANLYGNPLYKGKISMSREMANFNVPFSIWGNNSIVGSFSYLNQHYKLDQVQDFNPAYPVKDANFNRQTVGFSISYTHRDSLFSTPVIYSSTLTGITDQLSAIEKVSYLGAVVFPLKRSSNNAFTIGVAVILDRSTLLPVWPVFNYWHQFSDKQTELFVDLPTRISLRRTLTPRSWLSFGTALNSTYSFFSLNQPTLPQDVSSTQVELKTGASYEYRVTKKLMFSVAGGLFSTIDSRIAKRTDDWNVYFIRDNKSTTPYMNFTISFLPFFRQGR